jgi:hypothetical protein
MELPMTINTTDNTIKHVSAPNADNHTFRGRDEIPPPRLPDPVDIKQVS